MDMAESGTMSKDNKTNPSVVDNYEKYLLHGRGAIIQKLRQLAKSHSLITAHFGGGQHSLLTAVLEVLPEKEVVVLDYGANEKINRKILEASRIVFKTQYEGITAQFTVDRVQRAKRHGKTTFACPLPESLLWVQRREFYRVRVPLGDPVFCEIPVGDEEPLSLRIIDISVGGVGLEDAENRLDVELEQHLPGCKLKLGEHGDALVNLEVRNFVPLNPDDPAAGRRIGCQIHDLAMDMNTIIQRYIHAVEALRRRVED